MATDYRARFKFPNLIDAGDPDLPLLTKSGLLVACGLVRVVIGGHGPYVEFTDEQIVNQAIHWVRIGSYYTEFRTNDACNVKVYLQHWPVEYADYKNGFWYISPFDLMMENGETLIDPLPRRRPVEG